MANAARQIRPFQKAVTDYYRALEAFRSQEVEHEQAVRAAFQSLVTETAKPFRWVAIPELGSKKRGKRVIPDGTMRDQYHIPRGHWEAKDSADDLDAEITAKCDLGYPTENIIFWSPDRAVLVQEGEPRIDHAIGDDEAGRGALCDILNSFFTYAAAPILDFDEAVKEFTSRVPELGNGLACVIADAHRNNRRFKDAFASFFGLCRTSLNPNISEAAVDEMLVQHLLTERLFKTVFKSPEFARRNVIAAEVETVIDALSSTAFTREQFLKALDRFYLAIENAAAGIADFADKQHFLNSIYERFFQGYCVKTADTHGIVYTPQPIVDFMCASVEHVLKEEFGKQIGDDGVLILDPCTGTGNFVVNLLRRAAARGRRHLQRVYREQLFANELMLMPYYIAALNAEHAYFEETGTYESFEGLCFVDTLELAEPRNAGLFTEKNAVRVERQKNAPITVVIGNPPYNVGQMVHNDRNQNRPYKVIDERIRLTYGRDSAATSVSKLNDPYVKFFRWATDRLRDRDGIVCFVSNNSFVDKFTYDGMRKHLAKDFQAIYHIDLQGDVRQNQELSGTQYNVFGIQLGVGITLAVKHRDLKTRGIRYAAAAKTLRRDDKLCWLAAQRSVANIEWQILAPDAKHTWLVPANASQFAGFMPIAERAARRGSSGSSGVVFRDYSLGIATHRDAIVYDFSRDKLIERVRNVAESYNAEVDRWKRAPTGTDIDGFVRYENITWDRDLKSDLKRGRLLHFDAGQVRDAMYRPFTRRHLYFDRMLNAEVYGFHGLLPKPAASQENRLLCCSDISFRSERVSVFAVQSLADLHLCATLDGHQCFPFYVYDEDGSNRRENITDWALKTFREHYRDARITKWNIFHYVYAVLHHPWYRETFADNLKRELPRIPLAPDFESFMRSGEKLMRLHLEYDDPKAVAAFPLKQEWAKGTPKSYRVGRMKLSKDKSALFVNESLTLSGIPPETFDYRLGNRSALEWVVDQYQTWTDKRSGIVSDPNAWGDEHDDEEYIVRLVKQIVTVSVETNAIVHGLPEVVAAS